MDEITEFVVWVSWNNHIVSFQEKVGFERLTFCSEAALQANLQILLSEGFRFQ